MPFLFLRTWKKKPKTEGIASVGIEEVASGLATKFIRWKVHGDWVQEVGIFCNASLMRARELKPTGRRQPYNEKKQGYPIVTPACVRGLKTCDKNPSLTV